MNYQPTEQEWHWIESYYNGSIEPDDFKVFESALLKNQELRKVFRQYGNMDHGLQQGTEEFLDISQSWSAPEKSDTKIKWIAFRNWPAIAALFALALFILFRPDSSDLVSQSQEPSAQGFGVLTGEDSAQWSGEADYSKGDLIPPGIIELVEGIAQIELFSGVTLIIEGAARFEFVSSMEMKMNRGKLRAHVPEPAHGFKVISPGGEIVDLGTEFAIDINNQSSEIHVLEGSIEWHPDNQSSHSLMKEGEGIRQSKDGETIKIASIDNQFISISELNQRLLNQQQNRRNQWLTFSQELTEDESLVAYFPILESDRWNRNLRNHVSHNSFSTDGAIVAAKRIQDRFGNKLSGLDFSQTGSRVRLNVNKELSSLTFMVWAKIDSLDRWYNSLFLTDGHELNEPHWQIMDDGRLFFSVKRRTYDKKNKILDKHIVYSKPFWTPALSGQWIHIATTYNTSNYQVSHYVNGEVIHQETLPENMRVDRVKIGAATLGNWSEPTKNDPHFAIRNLNGSMDEFSIFSKALTPEKIREIYEIGKP